MDNLITTVIAVALIGVTVLMGVTMGSDAILNYQAKSEASQIVSDAQTIAAAWKSYARGNNGNPALTNYAWATSSADLVSAYLSKMPIAPTGAIYSYGSSILNYNYTPIASTNFRLSPVASTCNTTGYAAQTNFVPADTIQLRLKSYLVCQAIAQLAGYTSPTLMAGNVSSWGGVNIATTTTRRPFDCIYTDDDSSGGPSEGDTMMFFYFVFEQNNVTPTSNPACPYP